MDAFQQFHQLHHQAKPLVVFNAWDPASAIIGQQLGHQAIATSSASLAWANGFIDGEQLPVDTLLNAVAAIARCCQLPLSVDIEQGFNSNPRVVAELVSELRAMGVVGINIEDGPESPELLMEKIRQIKTQEPGVFVNARTDVYLRNLMPDDEKPQEILRRHDLYQSSGADGLFIPGLGDKGQVENLVAGCQLPINLMGGDVSEWAALGVKRVSQGPGTFLQAYGALLPIVADQEPLDFARMNDWMGKAK